MTLSLRDVMEHVLAMPPGSLVYLDRRTGALRLVTEEISEAAGREVDMSSRPDWEPTSGSHSRCTRIWTSTR